MSRAYVFLALAIILEVAGTMSLQASAQFTKWGPVAAMAVFYLGSFWLLSLVLRDIPVAIAYAMWSGLGNVLVAVTGTALFGQRLDAGALAGISLIIAGVVVMNLFSTAAQH